MGKITWSYPRASIRFADASKETLSTVFLIFVVLLSVNYRCQELITRCWHFV